MGKGRNWPAEVRTFRDPRTGVTVRQLTNYKGHSHHFYFTNPGWYGGGQHLLFASDRENRTNLFSLDLHTGTITQLTDLDMPPPPAETSFLYASLNLVREEVYFWHGRRLMALDLRTLAERVLYEAPEGFIVNMTNCTADGRYVCTVIYEDLSHRFAVDLLHGYVGFREYWEARPLSRILQVATDGSGARVAFEERYWIGHVNTSPTQPHLLSFCHEGPWEQVDQRIWGLDLRTGQVWKIRPTLPGERVGHEYWLADGLHIGYHGRNRQGPVFGFVRYDNSWQVEAQFAHDSNHFHSNDLELIVGDGRRDRPDILLWRFRDGQFEGPRVLCTHRSSSHIQQTHVHPRFSPDGRYVLFTSDRTGYGNLYLVEVPAFESLPTAAP